MKKRETVKTAASGSNSDGETNEKSEKNENGDENAAPEKSKTTDAQAENAANAEENGMVDKPAEGVNDGVKDAAVVETDKKKTTNGRKSPGGITTYSRKFIRLTCVHCRTNCVKFQVNFDDIRIEKEKKKRTNLIRSIRQTYTNHLYLRKHKVAMRQVALRQKSQIARMRSTQRKTQRELEKNIADIEGKPLQFCMLCRLNYRTAKDEHEASESHVNMKKFLLPYCKICRISFKSPMVYETHRCSLEHIKVLRTYLLTYILRPPNQFQSNTVILIAYNSANHIPIHIPATMMMRPTMTMTTDFQWIWINS